MSQSTRAVTVGTTATRLDDPSIGVHAQVTYYNAGSVTVTLGTATTTPGNGLLLAPGQQSEERLTAGNVRYGIVASGTCQVNVDSQSLS
jgi:hypothetical protein